VQSILVHFCHFSPTGLSDEFATDEYKIRQWKTVLARSQLERAEIELGQVIDELRPFLPVREAGCKCQGFPFHMVKWRSLGGQQIGDK